MREAAVVNEYPVPADAAIAAGLDTAAAIGGIAAVRSDAEAVRRVSLSLL